MLDDPAAAVADLLAGAAGAGSIVLTAHLAKARLRGGRARRRLGRGDRVCDERCVPEDHEWSNHGMAEAALLSHLDPAAGGHAD